MKLSDFDFLFKVNPNECAGHSKKLKYFLMDTFPEKGTTIGNEVREFDRIYDQYLLGEIQDFKTEWAQAINISPDIIPQELLQIDGERIELFRLVSIGDTDKNHTVYYKSTVLTFTKAWHRLMKEFCNVDMELITDQFSYIVLKNGQKLQVENFPFIWAFYDCVRLYYNPQEWKKRIQMIPQATFLETLVTNFLAVAITSAKDDSVDFKKNNLLVCSFLAIEEKKIKESFYKAA
jgi:hypothetical protein